MSFSGMRESINPMGQKESGASPRPLRRRSVSMSSSYEDLQLRSGPLETVPRAETRPRLDRAVHRPGVQLQAPASGAGLSLSGGLRGSAPAELQTHGGGVMSFSGMRESINPMDQKESGAAAWPLRHCIVSMSSRLVIPRRVALQQSPLPLGQPHASMKQKHLAGNLFAANGRLSLIFVSHPWGAVQYSVPGLIRICRPSRRSASAC